jgi:hypothetical protein
MTHSSLEDGRVGIALEQSSGEAPVEESGRERADEDQELALPGGRDLALAAFDGAESRAGDGVGGDDLSCGAIATAPGPWHLLAVGDGCYFG